MAAQQARILLVEDDASLNEIVRTFLSQEGYEVIAAFSGSEAKLLIDEAARDHAQGFDLMICDLMLPGLAGEELVPHFHARLGELPVIVTSAKSAVSDRVGLLRCGANDYLVKPFDLEELAARIEVQLRQGRAVEAAAPSRPTTLTYRAWSLDPERRAFCAEGQTIKLTRTEFDILEALMHQPERVFSKRDLYLASCRDDALLADTAAGADAITASDERTVSTHVSNLRAKLKAAGAPDYIQTVWGIGFKLA